LTSSANRGGPSGLVECHGFVHPGFEPVREAFKENLAGEIGAAFAAMVDGVMVVDIWGGLRETRRRLPWERDTMATIFSGSKGLVATCVLRLIDQGALHLDDRVCDHWPEFAVNGKEGVLVRHIMSHTAGLPGVRDRVSFEDVADPEKVAAMLAAQSLFWPAGERLCYHPLTYGWLCGELVRRVTGRTLGRYLHEEITGPLGIAAWIGVPPDRLELVADSELAPDWETVPAAEPPGDISALDLCDIWLNPDLFPSDLSWNHPLWRTAEIPGAGAIATARGMAAHYGLLVSADPRGEPRILSVERVAAGAEELSRGIDPCDGDELVLGTGWALQDRKGSFGPAAQAFGHGGAGGSIHGAWPAERTGFSYVMNLMRNDDRDARGANLLTALYESVSAAES
jgi:CubicO group peptidase (beta-lactamase class C family)